MRFLRLFSSNDRHALPRSSQLARGRLKLICVVEGAYDIAFLQTLSRRLHGFDPAWPDAAALAAADELMFLPIGGDALAWAGRLAPLGVAELHLFDRSSPREDERRRQAARLVNRRPRCRAYVTSKRSLENYLHPDCIREISGLDLSYGDDDDVAELVARACHERSGCAPAWESLPGRARKRRRERTRKWLNRLAVELMTPERLSLQDPQGEIGRWLRTVAELMEAPD
jgi:hypothetical protein